MIGAPRPLYGGAAEQGEQKPLDCPTCGGRWTIPIGLFGVQVRCRDCSAMIAVADAPRPPERAAPRRIAQARPPKPLDVKALAREGRQGQLPVLRSRDADRGLVGVLDHAPVKVRAAWTNRALLEVVAVMFAFLGPILIMALTTVGEVRFSLMPIASVISGLLVLLIGLSCPGFAFGAIRMPPWRYIIEAALVTLPMALLGHGLMELLVWYEPSLLDDSLLQEAADFGLPAVLFVMALCPGIFEEIAFRGILQARLSALYGAGLGAIYTAIMFGLAHMVTPALPIHILLGFYLVWLRFRCNSLIPCMVFHIGYNSLVMVFHLQAFTE